ncbi:hypothetical protein MASR2M36_22520 [Providencia sp.]
MNIARSDELPFHFIKYSNNATVDTTMQDSRNKKSTPYSPKTCPFCHFYGIRKNKEDWSCDMCGLAWVKPDAPKDKN